MVRIPPIKTKKKKSEAKPVIKVRSENNLFRSPSKRLQKIKKHFSIDVIEEKEEVSPKKLSCKCTNTKCIKLYCICFKNDQFCGSECECTDCLNFPEESAIREKKKKVLVNPDELSYLNRFKTMKVKVKKKNGELVEEGK